MAELDWQKLEKKIHRIQKSTRTLFPVFSPAHNWLRSKLQWYYKWHIWEHSSKVHAAAFFGIAVGLVLGIVISTNSVVKPLQTRATGTSWIVASAGDSSYNGTYVEAGTQNGYPYYVFGTGGSTRYLFEAVNPASDVTWRINGSLQADPSMPVTASYYTFSNPLPGNPWNIGAGAGPAPSLSAGASGITISGFVYSAEDGLTNIGASKTVALSINGAAATTAETDINGAFSFSSVTVAANNTVSLFISGETEKGSLITQAIDSGTSITGLELFASHVVLSHQTAGPMTNTLLATADNVSDADLLESVDGSNIVTFAAGDTVWVISGKNYTPGAAVSAGKINVAGTFTPEANTITLGDSGNPFIVSGTFTAGGSTIKYAGVGDTTITAATYNNLETSPSSVSSIVTGYIASGAGDTSYNGTYTQSGTYNDQLAYTNGTTWLFYNSGWYLDTFEHTSSPFAYSGGATLPGSWVVGMGTSPAPTMSAVYSAYTYTFASGTVNINGNYTNGDGANSVNTTADANDPIVNVNGNFINSVSATFSASASADFSVAANYSNNGVFIDSSGLLTFDGQELQTITAGGTDSSHDFNNLTVTNASVAGVSFVDSLTASGTFTDVTASSKLTFHSASTYAFNNINISGLSVDTRIILTSSSAGSAWNFTITQSSPTASYVSVKDSNANKDIDATIGGLDSTGNTHWLFSPAGITISGTVYTSENKSTNIGAGKTVAISVNGGAATTVATAIGGVFSFLNVSISANSTVAVYISGDTMKGSLVTQAVDESTDITSLEIFTGHISLSHQTAGPMTNTLLATADNVADTDLLISVDGSNVATFTSGNIVWIITGKAYTPGANVNAGSLTVTGTFTPEGNTVVLNDSGTPLTITGTFTAGASTISYAGASATNITATTYNNLYLNHAGTTFTAAGDLTVSSVLTINTGILDASNRTITLSGASGTPFVKTGTFTAATSTVKYTGNNTSGDTTMATANYYNLYFDNGSETFNAVGDITVSNVLTINSGTFTSSGTVTLSGSGTPLVIYGTLSPSNITYTSASTTNVAAATYVNLLLDHAGTTFTAAGNITASASLNINAGTFAAADKTITLSGGGTPFVITGTFSEGTSTISYTGSSATNITSTTYNNLITNHAGVTFTAAGDITVKSVLTIQAGAFDASSRTIILSGAGAPFVNSGTFTASTSTVKYTGAGNTTIAAATYNNLETAPLTSAPSGYLSVGAGNDNYNDFFVESGTNDGYPAYLGQNHGKWLYYKTLWNGYLMADGKYNSPAAQYGGGATLPANPWSVLGMGGSPVPSVSFVPSGYAYSFAAGTININGNYTNGDGIHAVSITADAYDPIINIDGNFSNSAYATFIASGSAALSVASDFSNVALGTFTDMSGGLTCDGQGLQIITANGTDDGHDFKNLIVTNASAGGISFADSATVTGIFTDTTASSKLIFHSTSTYAFTAINLNGQATGTRIVLTSSSAGSAWLFNVAGASPTASYVDVKDSNAAGGNTITATTGSYNRSGNTNWSFAVPDAPTIGTATRGNSSASVTFTPPGYNGGSAITGYTVTSTPGSFTGTGASSPIVVSGLTNGTQYTFTVHATNSVGNSAESAASNTVVPATTPGAPTIGTTTRGNTQASVAFTPPASNGGDTISAYTVTSSPGSFTGSGASSPITVSGLTNGTSYTFTVHATNSVGNSAESAASNTVVPATTPGAPTIGTTTAGDGQASIAFSAPASNGGDAITGYTVISSPGNRTGTGSNSPIIVTGLTNGTSYTFTVHATNSVGNSAESAVSNTVTPLLTFTISGSCKQYDEVTNCSDGETVKVALNSVLQAQTGTTSGGSWSITGLTAPTSGDAVSIFISGATDGKRANALTKYFGADLVGMALYERHLNIGNGGQTVANSDLAKYDGSVSGNNDIFYDVDSSGNLQIPFGTTGYSDQKLLILSTNTYQPRAAGGISITVPNLIINSGATFTANANIINLTAAGTPLVVSGTFNEADSTINYNSSSAISIAGTTYSNLTLNHSGTTFTAAGSITVSGILRIAAGIFNASDKTITLTGSGTPLVINDSFISATSTIKFEGSSATNIPLASYYNLYLNHAGTTFTAAGDLGVAGVLSVNAGTFDASSRTVSLSGSGTPLVINGNFTPAASTIEYAGSSDTNVAATTYNNLTLNHSATTFNQAGTINVNSNFNFVSGTYSQGTDRNLRVDGNFTLGNSSTFSKGSGSSKLILTGDQPGAAFTDPSASQNFGSVQIGASPGDVNLASNFSADDLVINSNDTLTTNGYNITLSNSLTINVSGTLDATTAGGRNSTIILGGSGTPFVQSGNFTASTSTVRYAGSLATNITGTAYYNLDLEHPGTTFTAAGNINVAGVFTISAGTLAASDKIITLSGSGTPFVNSGTFNEGTSTINYVGSSATNVAGTTYYNLTTNHAGTTFTAAGPTTITNIFNVSNGTFDANSRVITLTGSGAPFIRTGTFSAGTSTVKYTGAGNTTITATDYYNLETSPSASAAGGYLFSGAGDSSYNGTYTQTGTNNGRPKYTNGNRWLFNDYCEGPTANDWAVGPAVIDLFAPFQTGMAYYSGPVFPSVDTAILSTWDSAMAPDFSNPYSPPAPTVTALPTVYTYTFASGTINISGNYVNGDGSHEVNTTADTNNPVVNIDGSMTNSASATFVASASAAFSVASNYSNSGTFTDSAGTLTLDGQGLQTVIAGGTDADHDFKNLTITNASAQGVAFADSVTVTGTFSDTTASSKLTFHSTSTYAFNAININGQSTGTRIILTSSNSGSAWNLNISEASPVASNVDVRDSSANKDIDATVGGRDSTGNTHWLFPVTVSDAPTIGTAVRGNAQASVSFTPPIYEGGSSVTGYTVTSTPGNITGTGSSSPIIVSGLTNGTSYTFTVHATNSSGASLESAATNSVIPATIPGAPTIGTAVRGNAQAVVAFTPPSDNGGDPITGYTVTSAPGNIKVAGTASPIIVSGLSNGTTYTFTVQVANSIGSSLDSAASNQITPATVPGVPLISSVTAGNGQAFISFATPISDGGDAITNYTVTSTPGNISVSGLASPINITGLTNGTSYSFTIRATNSLGDGANSALSEAVTLKNQNPVPGWITLNSASVTVKPHEEFQFTGQVYDTDGMILDAQITWKLISEAAGSLASNGLFRASDQEGNYNNAVMATAGNLTSYASIIVKGEVATPPVTPPGTTLIDQAKKMLSNIGNFVSSVASKTGKFAIDQTKKAADSTPAKIAVLVVAATSSVVTAGASIIGVVATQMSLKDIFLVLFNYIMAFFAARRKDKMGMVFDQLTGRPVEKAVVELFSYKEMKLVSTALTDKNGHFFFVVKAGDYVISVLKPGYLYPSVHVSPGTSISENYLGQVITIENGSGAINVSIPIDAIASTGELKHRPFINFIRSKALRYIFSIIGTILAVYSLVTNPSQMNYVIAGIFALLWALEFGIINRSLKFSIIIDNGTGKPISLALVRLQTIDGHFSEAFVSDEEGKVLPRIQANGEKLIIEKFGYKTIEHKTAASGFIEHQRFHMKKDENEQ